MAGIEGAVVGAPVPPTVWTVGHGTRSLDELVLLLVTYGIRLLVDIRSLPRSRRNPQFNRDTLPAALAPHGIDHLALAALGGLRGAGPRLASPNGAWVNDAFRRYADHMATPEFAVGLEALLALAVARPTAVMCAETVWWRCHRRLVADALVVRGVTVWHILSPTRAERHALTRFARVDGTAVTYPAPAAGPGA